MRSWRDIFAAPLVWCGLGLIHLAIVITGEHRPA